MFENLQSNAGTLWCNLVHDSVMWPVHGHYECRTCGRRYPAFAETKMASVPDVLRVPASASLHRA